jgi:hypothetical protein
VCYAAAIALLTLLLSPLAKACAARTSSLLPDDLALSSTYLAESNLSMAIIFGCSESQRIEIVRRLKTIDLSYNHPVLLPGMVAELERIRLISSAEKLLDRFVFRALPDQDLDLDMDKATMANSLKLCFESRDLINQMEAEKRQLAKMMTRTNRLGDTLYSMKTKSSSAINHRLRKRLRQAGHQISTRLGEISHEYDERTSDCNMILENTSLTMQTVP